MNRYRRYFLPAALLLPLIGLGLVWLATERQSRQGTEWNVPIAGYDPRDLLRGQYVQFRYDWPLGRGENLPPFSGSIRELCITGTSPDIARVDVRDRSRSGRRVTSSRCAATAKVNPWSEEGEEGLIRDRIYVPQQAARDLQAKLANPELQGIVRIRINSSGFITPLSLTFKQRNGALAETP